MENTQLAVNQDDKETRRQLKSEINLRVLNIYWQAWGYQQAQLQRQFYIKKTMEKLDRMIKILYANDFSKNFTTMIYNYQTQVIELKKYKIKLSKNLDSFMKELEYFSKMCLGDYLPIYTPTNRSIKKFDIFLQSQKRIFRPFNKRPKHLNVASVMRVDAILCLF